MPKELQGQKPTADAIQANALVAKISTGEIDEDLKEPLGKVRYGKAGATASYPKLPDLGRAATAMNVACAC